MTDPMLAIKGLYVTVAGKEILRGLAAAREMDMDCRPFEDALAERHRSLDAA